jgi:sulfur-oxidizing protein SoxX
MAVRWWRGVLLGALGMHVLNAQSEARAERFDLPLTTLAGNPVRGKQIVLDRQQGFCLLCHSGPFPEERFQGTLAPRLDADMQSRTASDFRARLIDPRQFNPESIMPAYFQAAQGFRVHRQFEGKTLLKAQDIEDVVAFLLEMKR